VRIIEITRDSVSLVDDEDYAHINSFNWALNPQGAGYAVRKGRRGTGEKRTVQMHRQILNAPHGWQIDHINGNSLDNRRSNLRISSVQTNAFNRKKPAVPSTSKYKGVLQRKHKTGWEARVKYSDKAVHLGTFDSERIAAGAYNYAAELMFGEFARKNEGIPEPSSDVKALVYRRCLAQVLKRNWHPATGAFSLPENARASNE